MEEKQLDLQEKREARRRRRVRNQIAAYVTIIILIAGLAVGIVFGVKAITQRAAEQPTQEEVQQEKVEELLSTEESIEVPPETEEVVELTPEQKLDEIVNAGIEVMPLEDKVAGLFLVTPESITGVSTAVKAGDGTREALSKYAVGGIVYFGKNMQSKEQLKEMIDNTLLYTKYPLFIAVDEEGGSVSRLASAGLADKSDSAEAVAESGNPDNAYQVGVNIGTYLSEFGFNLDFAPVADLEHEGSDVMGSRSYGSDAAVVSPFVTSMLQGLEEQNVTGCLKHFPGLGSSKQDTHDGLATTDLSADEFRANEFEVFRAGIEAGADMIMVGHMSAPSLVGEGDKTPCSLSSAVVTDILRGELGYDGVVITDALNMGAIAEYYGSDQAAIMALKAGCDMILMPEDFEAAYNGVLAAVNDGTISEERINDSLRRIYRIKYADKITE